MDSVNVDDEGADLGLGNGLRPGGLHSECRSSTALLRDSRGLAETRQDSYSDSDLTCSADVPSKTSRFLQRLRRRQKARSISVTSPCKAGDEMDPVDATHGFDSTPHSPLSDVNGEGVTTIQEFKGEILATVHERVFSIERQLYAWNIVCGYV